MGKKTDSLGDRMKGYENISRNYLTRRVPVIIRIDGKAFHTFTKGMKKPFDRLLMTAMQETMQYLCKNIQGCVFGYTQSDEITLVLTDYEKITTDAWFGYNIQKMASISASMATLAFNKFFRRGFSQMAGESINEEISDAEREYRVRVYSKFDTAMFDSRVFTVPKDEVCNCLIWRQQDATRNSIEAVGQANFSHKQLHCKTCNDIQEMLWQEKQINWNDFPVDCKRGSACYCVEEEIVMPDPKHPDKEIPVKRKRWQVDKEIPVFTQDRAFIERWL